MSDTNPEIDVRIGPLDLTYEDLTNCQSSRAAAAPANPAGDPNKGSGSEAEAKSSRDCGKDLKLKKWLFGKRLEYARYFFDHHAKQRMSMFNFFLIFVGFVIAGYATLLKDGDLLVAGFLALVAAFLTVCFICLERRNEELVHMTEDVLESLESDVLFYDYNRPVKWPRRRGLLRMKVNPERENRPLGIFRRQTAEQDGRIRTNQGEKITNVVCAKLDWFRYDHGVWIPTFQISIFLLFIILGFIPVVCRFCPQVHRFCGF